MGVEGIEGGVEWGLKRRPGKEKLIGLNQFLVVGSSLRPLNWRGNERAVHLPTRLSRSLDGEGQVSHVWGL